MTTEETLKHHQESLAAGDLDAVMSDYSESSVVITPDGALHGIDQIRQLFDKILKDMLPPGSDYELLHQEIVDEVAYTVWRGESETFNILMGTDTFIIRYGKIVCQTFAAQILPKGAFKSLRPKAD
ncbi:MAG: nuclear transport factor 2 family protein [Deltaproteobacteria bacterium]|nr:nuclear transport factor 2 family protein [Deltaproteobacteria bacterium]